MDMLLAVAGLAVSPMLLILALLVRGAGPKGSLHSYLPAGRRKRRGSIDVLATCYLRFHFVPPDSVPLLSRFLRTPDGLLR